MKSSLRIGLAALSVAGLALSLQGCGSSSSQTTTTRTREVGCNSCHKSIVCSSNGTMTSQAWCDSAKDKIDQEIVDIKFEDCENAQSEMEASYTKATEEGRCELNGKLAPSDPDEKPDDPEHIEEHWKACGGCNKVVTCSSLGHMTIQAWCDPNFRSDAATKTVQASHDDCEKAWKELDDDYHKGGKCHLDGTIGMVSLVGAQPPAVLDATLLNVMSGGPGSVGAFESGRDAMAEKMLI